MFNSCLDKTLKQVHSDLTLSTRAKIVINQYMKHILHRVCNEASNIAKNRSDFLDGYSIEKGMNKVLPGKQNKKLFSNL